MNHICGYAIGILTYSNNKKIQQMLITPSDCLPICVKKSYSFTLNNPEELHLETYRSIEHDSRTQQVTINGDYRLALPKGLAENTRIDIEFIVNEAREFHINIQIPDICYQKKLLVETLPEIQACYQTYDTLACGDDETTVESYFHNIIGMKSIKEKLSKRYSFFLAKDKWQQMGIAMDMCNWNYFIAGEKGSGKSTLTNVLSKMMYQLHLINNSTPITFHAKSIIEDCGILHSEEIGGRIIVVEDIEYICPQLENIQESDYSHIWLYIQELLEKEAEKIHGRNYYFFTGDNRSIKRLLEQEPRLELLTNFLEIAPYFVEELTSIAQKMIAEKGFYLSSNALGKLKAEIIYELGDKNFSNMITLEKIIAKAIENKSARESNMQNTSAVLEAGDFVFEIATEESLEELLLQLDGMIGLQQVKQQVHTYVQRAKKRKERLERGEDVSNDSFFLHTLLLGAPGTGKTTVARLLGKIYGSLGILRNGSLFVEATRSDFVGQYQGTSAIKTKELIQSAVGGVLFVDEAYSLFQGDGDTFGREAVTEFLKYAWDYRDRMMIILAGYENEMDELMRVNAGMARRFPHRLVFKDYTTTELYEIFERKIKGRFEIDEGAKEPIRQLIERYHTLRGYENGGGIDIHIEALAGVVSEQMIFKEDVAEVLRNAKKGIRPLEELLEELNHMVGLHSVKKAINDVINAQKYQQLIYKQLGKRVEISSEHMIFAGPPGTGKSTIAQLITQIYCALGIVRDPTRCITITKSDISSDVMGGALEKVKQIIEKARGGVLFIDEAYALVEDEKDFYGKQVLTELMYSIEKYRGEIVLIMAGYKEQIDELIRKYNPGMASRISTVISFEEYTLEELVQIFYCMTKKGELNYEIEEGIEPLIKQLIEQRMQQSVAEGKEFGNARGVRNLMNEVIRCVVNRCMGSMNTSNMDEDMGLEEINTIKIKKMTMICKEDIEKVLYHCAVTT